MTDAFLRKPFLWKGTRIVPCPGGWMVQVGHRVTVVRSRIADSARDLVPDLLNGRSTIESIARRTQASISEIKKLVEDLARLRLLRDSGSTPRKTADPRKAFQLGAGGRGTRRSSQRLLLVGLDRLGRMVLHELLSSGFRKLLLFDPDSILKRDRAVDVWRNLEPDLRRTVRVADIMASSRDALREQLTKALRGVHAVVCCSDRPDYFTELLAETCGRVGAPLVVTQLTDAGGIVGPLQLHSSGEGGCVLCASLYQARQTPFSWNLHEYLLRRFPSQPHWTCDADPAVLSTLADLVRLALIRTIEEKDEPPLTEGTIWTVEGTRADVRARGVPKHYRCDRCYTSIVRNPIQLRREIERSWRRTFLGGVQEPADLMNFWRLKQSLVDPEYGIFRLCEQDPSSGRRNVYKFFNDRGVSPKTSPIANSYAAVAARAYPSGIAMAQTYSEGSDFEDPRKAESLALIEGLERLFALDYCDPKRIMTGRYAELAEDSLDPREFPLYAEPPSRQRRFGPRRFDPEEPIRWIWGIRLHNSEPVRVPFDLIYGGRTRNSIFAATSSGAACHSSFHHAVLNGIYETIERDSFMTVWLHRLSLPRLRVGKNDGNVMVRRDLEALSFDLIHVDLTTDLGIPVVLATLRDRLNPDFFLMTMASSLNRQEMLAKLHKEMVQFCRRYLMDMRHFRSRASENPNPNCVRDFRDHVAFYQSREKIEHARFLSTGPFRGWSNSDWPDNLEVRGQIEWIRQQLSEHGFDIIVVDCTVPFLRNLGLYAIKVLIPGLQPLHAGHGYAPAGTKLLQRPRLMGLAAEDRTVAALNPWPHPFW